ncbi:MAG: hypothetical protein ACYDAC_09895 [Candidatus Dormibacteria bacterium]
MGALCTRGRRPPWGTAHDAAAATERHSGSSDHTATEGPLMLTVLLAHNPGRDDVLWSYAGLIDRSTVHGGDVRLIHDDDVVAHVQSCAAASAAAARPAAQSGILPGASAAL